MLTLLMILQAVYTAMMPGITIRNADDTNRKAYKIHKKDDTVQKVANMLSQLPVHQHTTLTRQQEVNRMQKQALTCFVTFFYSIDDCITDAKHLADAKEKYVQLYKNTLTAITQLRTTALYDKHYTTDMRLQLDMYLEFLMTVLQEFRPDNTSIKNHIVQLFSATSYNDYKQVVSHKLDVMLDDVSNLNKSSTTTENIKVMQEEAKKLQNAVDDTNITVRSDALYNFYALCIKSIADKAIYRK